MNRIQFMKELSSTFPLYQAAKWLSEPKQELNGDNPAKYLSENNIEPIMNLLKKEKEKKKRKKK